MYPKSLANLVVEVGTRHCHQILLHHHNIPMSEVANKYYKPISKCLICSISCFNSLWIVTPYGDIDLGQHWLRQWLVAWRHQAINWTNVDLSSARSHDIHLRAFSQDISQPSIIKSSMKITYWYLKFHSNLPQANEPIQARNTSLVPSSLKYKTHQIPTLKTFSYCLAAIFAEAIEFRCQVENENVVGAAPTTSEWSTILLPIKVRLILEILR